MKRPWYNVPVPAVLCAKYQRRVWGLVSQPRYVERSPSARGHFPRFVDLALLLHYDEDATVYINGVLAVKADGFLSLRFH